VANKHGIYFGKAARQWWRRSLSGKMEMIRG
jgi:hypothetical protein